jgi:hypothetical protein
LRSDFPLNDGGLFYVMIQDLIRNNYAIPAYTTYNSANIPFVYPPLAFYLTAALNDLTGWPLISIMRVMPAIVSAVSIPFYYFLSRKILNKKSYAAMAVIAFAMLPRSFEWQIMGGGVTRSLGLVLALMTLRQIYVLYIRPEEKFFLPAALLAALTVLSHPEASWFILYSSVLLFFFFGLNRTGVLKSLILAAGVIAFTSPWWATVAIRHGLSAFKAASTSHLGSSWVNLLTFNFTQEPLLHLLGVLGLLGIFFCLFKKRFFLPAWLALVFLLEVRSASTYVVVPFAMLIAIGFEEVVLARFTSGNQLQREFTEKPTTGSWAHHLLRNRGARLLAAYVLLYGLASAIIFSVTSETLRPVQLADRQAMNWIYENTPPESQFLVITGGRWWQDPISEWFPVITQRISSATVQGTEWLPDEEFLESWRKYDALQACSDSDYDCLVGWKNEFNLQNSYVYFTSNQSLPQGLKKKCRQLAELGAESHDLVLTFEHQGITMFTSCHLSEPNP